jgi:phosphoribosylformylglycinamidine cyclo-ligase
MALIVDPSDAGDVTAALQAAGETVLRIGGIAEGTRGCTVTGGAETWSGRAPWSATHNG